MDQQQFNPYAPQPEATSGPIPYPGQDGQLQGQPANPGQQAYQPDYGMQQSTGAQPMQAYPQQPYGVPQPDPAQAAWQQGAYPVQGQQPYQPPMAEQQPYPMQAQPQQPYPMTAQMPQPYQVPPMQQTQPIYGGPAPMPTAQDASGAQTRSGLAIAGMVIGIVSLACSPIPIVNNVVFFVAIVGLVLSIIGLRGVAKNPARKGKGIAIAGIILSAVAIVLVLATQMLYGAVLDEVSDQLNESAASYSSGPATTYTPSANSGADAGTGSGLPTTGSSSDTAEEGAASTVSATQDLALGTAAEFSDGTTVTVVSVTPGVADMDGSTATQVTVTYANAGEKAVSFNKVLDWKAEDPQGVRRDVTIFFNAVDDLGSGELAAGGTVTGNIYFDEPISKVIYAPSLWSDANNVSWVIA